MCCCFRLSYKSALVVTRILIAIPISHQLAIRWKSGQGTRALILVCAQAGLRTLRGCLWLAFLRWNEPLPTDRKSAAGLSPVIELENEFIGDIERDWQGNDWSAGAIGRRGRIVLDHRSEPPILELCVESPPHPRWQLQTLCLKLSIACRERHGRIRGQFTPVRKWVPVRPLKFGDQLPNRPTAMVERLHQPFQTFPVALVPLF
jgi:hypothetical protein